MSIARAFFLWTSVALFPWVAGWLVEACIPSDSGFYDSSLVLFFALGYAALLWFLDCLTIAVSVSYFHEEQWVFWIPLGISAVHLLSFFSAIFGY
ncbi:MAG: hypothetical protein KDB61_08710 [Planctomycetes bacterium]|nr:hypothetical protein [Planctomycetota bacterium]